MRTLILTCAGGKMMPWLAKWQRRHAPDTRLIGFDANPELVANGVEGFDELFCVPAANTAGYVSSVLEIIRDLSEATILPGSDEEALVFARNSGDLQGVGAKLAISSFSRLEHVSDKLALSQQICSWFDDKSNLCKQVHSESQAMAAMREFGWPESPVVLKPSRGRGRRGVYVLGKGPFQSHDDLPPVLSESELPEILESPNAPDMIMPFVQGKNVTVDVLANRGKIIQLVVREWLQNWRFPFPGQRIDSDSSIEKIVVQVVREFQLHGLIDMDFILPREASPVLLEVNPRPSGSLVVSLAAGVPLLDQYMQLADGKNPPNVACGDRQILLDDLDA